MRISSFILVIDSYLVRKGMISVLNRIQGVRVLKEFGAANPFLTYLENHPIDFIIIDQSGFDRSVDLFISKPELLDKTILIQVSPKKGDKGDIPGLEAQASINLMEDKETLNSKIQNLLDLQGIEEAEAHFMPLSPREITIVKLVSMGHTNRQIAEKLFLSAHTVMTHRKNISSKLGIRSVSGLTIYAIVNNIITIEEVTSKPDQ
jgi:DNA-binding NarL/FixJ family response regulator